MKTFQGTFRCQRLRIPLSLGSQILSSSVPKILWLPVPVPWYSIACTVEDLKDPYKSEDSIHFCRRAFTWHILHPQTPVYHYHQLLQPSALPSYPATQLRHSLDQRHSWQLRTRCRQHVYQQHVQRGSYGPRRGHSVSTNHNKCRCRCVSGAAKPKAELHGGIRVQ